MLRNDLVEVVSGAGVGRQRAVRPRAWFRRRPGSSRVSEPVRQTVQLPKLSFPLRRRAVESTGEGAWRGSGWRGSRSCGCVRRRSGFVQVGLWESTEVESEY